MTKMYLNEFSYFDSVSMVTFNIIGFNQDNTVIRVAETYEGKIKVVDYDLLQDESGMYFEHEVMCNKVYIDDFEEV